MSLEDRPNRGYNPSQGLPVPASIRNPAGRRWTLSRSQRFALFLTLLWFAIASPAEEGAVPVPGYLVHPIGQIEQRGTKTLIILREEYVPGLLRLDSFTHVWVIWWFDRTDSPAMRKILQVHPRRNKRNPLTGVFATRAPVRPNPIGLSLCRILGIAENTVEIDGIDAFSGTPVLDLKPYLTAVESRPDRGAD